MQEKYALLALPGTYGTLFPEIPPQTSLQVTHLALITHFYTNSLKKYVREADLNIIREERHMLALFTLNALSRILPFMSKVFDEQRLMRLFEIEKPLLKNTFLRRF